MKRRTKSQWLSLIQEFEESGQTQTAFCTQHDLNPKYFSLRRMKLKSEGEPRPFVQAVTSDRLDRERVIIRYGKVSIELPASSVQAIAQLVRALAT